ncbi:MAG: hypothetical protein IJ679_09885 [Lachnospiraceae bacterium]|nr:hypothetical protein [Lachnospiraceae bacterium]
MASRASIEFDFIQAKRSADSLDQLAGQLERLAEDELSTSLHNIRSHWTGRSSEAYAQKGHRLQEQIRSSAKNLRNVATDIRETAQRMYEAEMRAKQIAETRTSG